MIRAAFPDKSSIVMVGSPGIGLPELNVSLAKNYLDEGDTVIMVTVDMLPKDLISMMESMGVDVAGNLGKKLFIVDYHSSLLGSYEEGVAKHAGDIRKVSDIEGIMFNVTTIAAERGRPVRIFLHSLSTLFLYNQTNVVLKFFQISSSKIRSELGTAIFTIHDGVHDEKTMNHIMSIADGVVELKFDENLNRRMRIRHMRGHPSPSQWIPFEIRQIQPSETLSFLEWL